MEAAAINNRGEIAGWERLSNGDIHPFLLTPCDDKHDGGEDCGEDVVVTQVDCEPSGSYVPQSEQPDDALLRSLFDALVSQPPLNDLKAK